MQRIFLSLLVIGLLTSTPELATANHEIFQSYYTEAESLDAVAPIEHLSNSDLWETGGPYGGYVNSLSMSVLNPDILFAGTEGGVFKTLNKANTWERTTFPNMLVRVVKVTPDEAGVVYAGTDDGIYKSEDGGSSWTQVGLEGARINDIAIDPHNPSIIYIGTGTGYTSPDIVGIFKSEDAGQTWQEKWLHSLSTSLAITKVIIDSGNSMVIYAGKSRGFGILKSLDGGDTWDSYHIGEDKFRDDWVRGLTMAPAGTTPAAIYASNLVPPLDSDVFKSIDGGETWQALGAPQISSAMTVDPNNPEVVFVGNYRSPDGGDTWVLKDTGIYGTPASIVIDSRNSSIIYSGRTNRGVYKSIDGSETWTSANQGMNDTSIADIAVHPTDSNTLYAAVDGQWVARSDNGGSSWDYLSNSEVHQGAIAITPQDPSTLWSGMGWGYKNSNTYIKAYRSTNGGQDWYFRNLFLNTAYVKLGVADIWVDPGNADIVLVAVAGFYQYGGGIYKTTNRSTFYRTYSFWGSALVSDPTNPEIVYFGSQNCGYVYQSIDTGGTWNNISPGSLPGECWVDEVRDLAVDSNSDVFAATDNGLKVWDGSKWVDLPGPPTDDLTAVVIDLSTKPNTLYLGTADRGIYRSADGGGSWLPFNDGLPDYPVSSLVISDGYPKMLYAGTSHGGVWSWTLDSSQQTQLEIFLPFLVR